MHKKKVAKIGGINLTACIFCLFTYQSEVLAIFPHNPSVGQFIKIYVDGNEYQAWGFGTGNYDVNGELGGKPMNLLCDLDSPKQTHKVNDLKNYVGICELK